MPTCVGKSSPDKLSFVEVPIATAKALTDYTAIAITSGTVTLPSDEAWDTNEATTRTNFVAKFVGINAQLKTANVARINGNSEDNIVVVENEGVYDVTVASATYTIGAMLGPSKAGGNALLDTEFKSVSAITEACFRVVEHYGSATTTVRARLLSTLAPAAK